MLKMEHSHLIRTALQLGDPETKGYLTKQDLKVAILFLFGYKPSKYEIKQLMRCQKKKLSDRNICETDVMSYETFESVMLTKLASECEDQKIRDLFCVLDIKCQGYLSFHDIESAFKQVAPHISQSTVAACMNEMCHHNDKKLSFREFMQVMKFQNSDVFNF